MSKFKFNVGDTVKVGDNHGYRPGQVLKIGTRSTINGGMMAGTNYYSDGNEVRGQLGVYENALSLVERAPIDDPDDSKPEATDITPAYYAFPGGIRVHQISGHLTSFGGQALQYIARSTRLDGQNKGDTAENLRKAIRFLNLEIERIEAEGE